jgi:DNA-directed RNA polymerase subunit E'/Rpb7
VQQSIEDSLRHFLLRYVNGVGGVVLAFDNVEWQGQGSILNEMPYIHYMVTCDVLALTPRQGAKLKGRVAPQSSFHSHLALLVMGYFNASISAKELRAAGYEFDDEVEVWYDVKTSKSLSIDCEVEFEVEKLHQSSGIISIDATKPRGL